jgi:hypothetical protein
MKTLLEIFEEAKDIPNMGEGRLLICINEMGVFNAKILDPYMGVVIVKDTAIHFSNVQAMNCQAQWAD